MNEKGLAIQRNRQPFLHCAFFPIAAPKTPRAPGGKVSMHTHSTPGALPTCPVRAGISQSGNRKASRGLQGGDLWRSARKSPFWRQCSPAKARPCRPPFLVFFVPFCPSKREAAAVKRAHHSFTPSCFGVRPARAVTGRMALKKRNSSTASSGHMPMFLTRLLAR